MANKRSERRQRWIALSDRRESHRISRLDKEYDPNKTIRKALDFRVNSKFKVPRASKGTLRIEFPARLDFESIADMDSVFLLVQKIRDAALKGGYRRILLAQENLEALAPEVAIFLLAELQRCWAYCLGKTVISGTYPRDPKVAELLKNLGFYDALKVPPPKLPGAYDPRSFIKVVSGHQTNSETIDTLLTEFDPVLKLAPSDKKNLHVAILECMDNVREHAYEKTGKAPHLYREWWLVGIADKEANSASFIFFDQGFGIVNTIKTYERKRLFNRLPRLTDAAWIASAVTEHVSRHGSARRGHGLPKLQQFIRDVGLSGSMRVIANKGEYTQITDRRATTRNSKVEAPGTMISWALSMPANSQLRLDI